MQPEADEGKQCRIHRHHSALLYQNRADGTVLSVHAQQYGGIATGLPYRARRITLQSTNTSTEQHGETSHQSPTTKETYHTSF